MLFAPQPAIRIICACFIVRRLTMVEINFRDTLQPASVRRVVSGCRALGLAAAIPIFYLLL